MIYIGIDGDGTLYDNNGNINQKDIQPLLAALGQVKKKARVYHLTGKDWEYVQELREDYGGVIDSLDFHLLENGAVSTDGSTTQLMIVKSGDIVMLESEPEFTSKLEAIANRLGQKGLSRDLIKVRKASVQYRGPVDSREKDIAEINLWMGEIYPDEFYATMSAYAIFINQLYKFKMF